MGERRVGLINDHQWRERIASEDFWGRADVASFGSLSAGAGTRRRLIIVPPDALLLGLLCKVDDGGMMRMIIPFWVDGVEGTTSRASDKYLAFFPKLSDFMLSASA